MRGLLGVGKGAVLVGFGAMFSALTEEWVAGEIIRETKWFLLFVLCALLYAVLLGHASLALMWRIDSRIGIKVRYVENDGTGRVYYSCKKVLGQARKSIHVLSSYLVERHSAGEAAARGAYYDALLDHAGTNIEYVRLIQVRPDGSTLRELKEDDVLSQHLRKVLDRKGGEYGHNLILKRCIAVRQTTFVLIDNVHLIWQINNVTYENNEERRALQGVFIIHDPQQRITGQFETFFNSVLRGDTSDIRWNAAEQCFQ